MSLVIDLVVVFCAIVIFAVLNYFSIAYTYVNLSEKTNHSQNLATGINI